jgi:predicted AAA+ superfamily ATPase
LQDRGLLLVEARGVGKTTFLLEKASADHIFYVSADNPVASTIPLYDPIEAAFLEGYDGVFVDEVHYAADWSQHIKAAYDSFPAKLIWTGGFSRGCGNLVYGL